MKPLPWSEKPVTLDLFRNPPREYGILPFWFLNGRLDRDEMLYQLKELQAKGMPGIILHGRYGLEMPYLGEKYLDRIRFAVDEAEKLGLQTWIYDEMNWPSGTADKRVLQERPDLAQRYIECINFTTRGPWFTYLTGADSRYLDFERSKPVAAFAVRSDVPPEQAEVIDLTPYLSFGDVIPWEAPAGNWRLMYIVEKRADYYIDALDPEATREFLKHGYAPYAEAVREKMPSQMPGFYTDEPAMHYYLTGGENPILPWTKDMFRRFEQRNGYNLRPRLPDLFFDIRADSARVRYDFFSSLTEFYSDAFYRQIHEWCQKENVLFTGHLLYEEWMRKVVRVEGNLFKHYAHMDVIGVDHLYPIVGSRDRPDEHVAIKVASSAAHQYGSPRLLCESFGGLFMDATMQRMKWIADWEYVLGVNLLNPHGFHYTLEGPRKRDWPPSQFYQYPWWRYYGEFSKYIARLSHMLSGGQHAAKVAVLWPLNAQFAAYTPQSPTPLAARIEQDFNVLTDMLLRLHYDFDYLDEDILAGGEISSAGLQVRDETYELIIVPPMAHMKLETVGKLEEFVAAGGRLLGMVFLPDQAFASDARSDSGLVDISARIEQLFGVDPCETQRDFRDCVDVKVISKGHAGGGKTVFLRTYALARRLPMRLQRVLGKVGVPENPDFIIEAEGDAARYFYAPPGAERHDITSEVTRERGKVNEALHKTLKTLITADIEIDNPEVFYLHRIKDNRDLYFLVNPTFREQQARIKLPREVQPVLWDPSLGTEQPAVPIKFGRGNTQFSVKLPPTGSMFVLTDPKRKYRIVETNITVESINDGQVKGYAPASEAFVEVQRKAGATRMESRGPALPEPLELGGEWSFQPEDDNSLVIAKWLTKIETPGVPSAAYASPAVNTEGWLPIRQGAWQYQLPTEPPMPYPVPVWYRIEFEAAYLPARLDLILDGFAGEDLQLYVNGNRVSNPARRSKLDAQMQAVDIAAELCPGMNVIAARMTLRGATDGLLDLVKLCGDYALEARAEGGYRIVEPQRSSPLVPWTSRGYPFFSGVATYSRRFELPAAFQDKRIFLDAAMMDDVLEVTVNGKSAGVRLWAPYSVEVTELLQSGENRLELRIANTLVNQLEAVERPSGLCGAPRLVPYNEFTFHVE